MNELFRTEAIARQTRKVNGSVMLVTPIGVKFLTFGLVTIVAMLVLFAGLASYSRKETVTGWLSPDAGITRITAPDGGIVQALLVVEGQTLAPGQSIATISLSRALDTGDSFSALTETYRTRRSALDDEAAGTMGRLLAEQEDLRYQRVSVGRELAEARTQAALLSERAQLANAEVDRAVTISAQGFLPRRELEARQAALLTVRQELSERAASVIGLERRLNEIEMRSRTLPLDIDMARARNSSARAGLDEETIRTKTASTYGVTNRVSGVVAALPVREGQTLQPGAVVAVLTPEGSDLQAELYAPSRAIGFIRPGQKVRLMYEAYPHEKFGAGEGVVTSISRTVLAPSEIDVPGLQLQEPTFRIRVKLNRDTLSAYGADMPLHPGMRVTADVIVDRRNLLEWLFDPLFAAGQR